MEQYNKQKQVISESASAYTLFFYKKPRKSSNYKGFLSFRNAGVNSRCWVCK